MINKRKALAVNFFLLLFLANGSLRPNLTIEVLLLQQTLCSESVKDTINLGLAEKDSFKSKTFKAFYLCYKGDTNTQFNNPRPLSWLEVRTNKLIDEGLSLGFGPRPPTSSRLRVA